MATLYELFDQITATRSVGHPEFQLLIQWDHTRSVFVIYCLPSCSWCYASTKKEVIEMVASWRALDTGWLAVGMRVSLPASGKIARCEACGWLFWTLKGYHEPGQYAYCSDCCPW